MFARTRDRECKRFLFPRFGVKGQERAIPCVCGIVSTYAVGEV